MFGNDPPSVYNTRDPSEDGEADVDPEVCCAAAFEEDGEGWEEEGEEVEEDVGGGGGLAGHCCVCELCGFDQKGGGEWTAG